MWTPPVVNYSAERMSGPSIFMISCLAYLTAASQIPPLQNEKCQAILFLVQKPFLYLTLGVVSLGGHKLLSCHCISIKLEPLSIQTDSGHPCVATIATNASDN